MLASILAAKIDEMQDSKRNLKTYLLTPNADVDESVSERDNNSVLPSYDESEPQYSS